jgi:hypothetical protein
MTRFRRIVVLGAVGAAVTSPALAHDGGRRVPEWRPAAIAQQRAEPPITATPRADCLPGSVPEGPMQGRVPAGVDQGYRCNLTVIGRAGSTGGFRVHRYVDRDGHECAYYDTTLLFPTNALSLSLEPTGVAVLDMTDPAHPVHTATLATPAMQTPHESLNISVERGLLAAVMGNPAFAPGVVDVYDLSRDCRHPELMASAPASIFGHESGMALDGRTFYPTSISTGHTSAVDLSNPRTPLPLGQWQFNTHGMSVSDDGNRGYLAARDGLIIVDLSEVQARRPNPQVREISRLTWSNMTIPQVAIPVTIGGRPYLVEIDEYSSGESGGSVAANGPRVGAARIIDISDERRPFVVSNIRLDVHQPENRAAIAGDPGAQSPVQGYAGHYCNVPQRVEPGILACSMIVSGLRVFDIRDPFRPKEIAYHVAPPSTISAAGTPIIDERANYAMSQPAFAPERGEIWYSDGTSGFYALRMDPAVWPFPVARGSGGCVYRARFGAVSATPRGRLVELSFTRRAQLPARIEVLRVSDARRVLRARRVARRTGPFTWLTRRPGVYVVRFTMAGDRRVVVLESGADGRVRVRRSHRRRASCDLVRSFRLRRPVFGGTSGAPMAGSFRLAAPARVTPTLTRGRKVVKRLAAGERRSFRFSLPARGLRRGSYAVRLVARSGEDQVSAVVGARRL